MSLFDYGFSQFTHLTLAEKGAYTALIPVIGATKKELLLSNASALEITLPRGEDAELIPELSVERTKAPIQKGAHLGTLYAVYRGKRIGSVPLVATETIPSKKNRNFFHRLFK